MPAPNSASLDDHVLPPVVEEVLDVPDDGGVGEVVVVRHLLQGPLEALREGLC